MPYDNQHSHVFIVDVSSIGEFKYKPGVNKIGRILRETISLACQSPQQLIKSLGIIISSQTEMKALVPVAPLTRNMMKSVVTAARKIEVDLDRATVHEEGDKGRYNLKSALVLALGCKEGLEESLEVHLLTSLSVTEIDVLLSGAKSSFKSEPALKSVNLISPSLEAGDGEADSELRAALLCRKFFSDELELVSHLRAALLCQPGDFQDVKVELGEGSERELISLDLHPRAVSSQDLKDRRLKDAAGDCGAEGDIEDDDSCEGPWRLTGLSSVRTAGVCQSVLTGAPLLAVPTCAVFLSSSEKEDNISKVFSLYRELAGQGNSLLLSSPESLYILTPCSEVSASVTFLLSEAVTGSTILPPPPSSHSPDTETDSKVQELVSRLPYHHYYNPLLYSSRVDSGRGRGGAQSKAHIKKII